MQVWRIILVIFLIGMAQRTLPFYLPKTNYIDFGLILTVYLGLQREPIRPMVVGCLIGLVQDISIGARLIGANGFAKTLIGYVLGVLSSRLRLENYLLRILILLVSSAVNSSLFTLLYYYFDRVPAGRTVQESVREGLWTLLGNFLAAIFLFPIFDRYFREAPYDSSRTVDAPRRKF